ncbi:MAG: Dna2/Cas4 domain-containing protein [Candidatus Caldarchaeum sp.]
MEPSRQTEIHVTDLCSPCLRRVWFDKKQPIPEDVENILRLTQGKAMHEVPFEDFEHEKEIEYRGVKGRIDEYANGVIVDKKFVDFVPSTIQEVQKYYSHYIKQLSLYALFLVENGLEFKQAFLLFVKRGDQTERGRRPAKAFDVTGFINLDDVKTEFEKTLETLKQTLDSQDPPEIPASFSPFDYPCSYCVYRTRCW